MNPLGLYIHIPFCHARCGYCDFVTFTGKEDHQARYIEALSQEISFYPRSSVSTVFLGGGTPSVLEPHQIEALFKKLRAHFLISQGAEITLEANPESITSDRLQAWREAGIHRLSIGLQAYDDGLLKAMGRLHTLKQFEEAYRSARAAGYDNINIDLIYGFVGQTFEGWKQTLASAVALRPEHLSLYALAIEQHTPFGVEGMTVNTDLQADMYAWAREVLPLNGYTQYEISNFALPGKECQHNLIYWRGQDYLGLGVGAVGCQAGRRWENRKNLAPYYKDISVGKKPIQMEEKLDSQTLKFERLMLGLRLREGVFWEEHDSQWLEHRQHLFSKGYLEEIQPGTWRIPDAYVPLTNQILLPFLPS